MKFLVENLKVDASREYPQPRITVTLVALDDIEWRGKVDELREARKKNLLLVLGLDKRSIEDRASAERDEALARCESLEADIERLRDKLKMTKEVWKPCA